MTVRKATPDDAFDVLMLAHQFAKEAPAGFKFSKDKVESFFDRVLADPTMVLFVSEDEDGIGGFIVGLYTDHAFNDAKMAAELGWFMTKDKRGGTQAIRLVKAFEQWAKDIGAEYVAMCDIIGLSDLANLYDRSGYSLTERTFMKEI